MKVDTINSNKANLAVSLLIAGLGATFVSHAEVTVAQIEKTYGTQLEVLGAFQAADKTRSILIVAGQSIAIASSTVVSLRESRQAAPLDALGSLKAGDMILVYGDLGEPAKAVVQINEEFVAGATFEFIKGEASGVDGALGSAQVQQLKIDLTPAMADPSAASVKVGDVVELVGTQPVVGGRFLATQVTMAPPRRKTNSIIGSSAVATPAPDIGTSSIIGASNATPQSIVGTSKVTPQSIVGTSKVSPQSIVGTSKVIPQSIVGTSKVTPQSIVGTSKVIPQSIVGTSKVTPLSIVGTSKVTPQSIVGTSKVTPQSIVGTSKVTPQSIVGTSKVSPQSIVGTSKVTPQSIVGTS